MQKGDFTVQLKAPIAKLSPDQIAAVQDYEEALARKFGNPVILIALDKDQKG